jgi:hypothetical protein
MCAIIIFMLTSGLKLMIFNASKSTLFSARVLLKELNQLRDILDS